MLKRYSQTTLTAMAGAALMIAHQVAGKAVRDSFFLSNYPASELPKMVIAAAAVTMLMVLLFARAMGRFGPQRLVPAGFLLSTIVHGVEYRMMPGNPALWSVLVYFHIVALGAILLSGFWSLMAESFDPRSAKHLFGRIAGAGTLGGIAGGLMAERVAAAFSAGSVLLVLAALHLLCCSVLAFARFSTCGCPGPESDKATSPMELFRRAPYLGATAILVLAGTSSAAILDYLFKAGAGTAIGKGAPLLRFFAIFYTCTQVLTFIGQTFLAQRSLQRFGIGRTISALPLGVGGGALVTLLAPVFPVFTLFRLFESSLRGSFYRAGYELLYTPIPAAEKRVAKTLIDVGCDRAGDALGSGIVQLMLWFGASFIPSGLLGAMLSLAIAGAWAASRLDAAYSGLVKQRLIDRAVELDFDEIQDSTTRSAITVAPVAKAVATATLSPTQAGTPDKVVKAFAELRSGDSRRVLAAVSEIDRLSCVLAAQLVSLLAWDEVSDAVRGALQLNPSAIAGVLTDHLTNREDVEFGIRRRIPRILALCDSQLAVHGLLAGLADLRFEVRFQCSRALDSLIQRRPDLKVPAEAVYAAVKRELHVARPIRDSRRLLDTRDGSDPNAFLDEILRERADQTLEHIFSLVASVLPREAVKIAFRSLHTDDPALRGLAIEYLDSVLPDHVREGLWALIDTKPPAPAQDSSQDLLGELLLAHESLMLKMKDGKQPDRP
jgi:ATP:ADP antiporter, AAA family